MLVFTLTECPSKCTWHVIDHNYHPESIERAKNGEYLICTSCAWSCATALKAAISDETRRYLLAGADAATASRD